MLAEPKPSSLFRMMLRAIELRGSRGRRVVKVWVVRKRILRESRGHTVVLEKGGKMWNQERLSKWEDVHLMHQGWGEKAYRRSSPLTAY